MKRTREHALETESRRAFENLLSPEWIFREKTPDYGIDAEIEIVEDELVTNKVLWIQLKATKTKKQEISHQMGTDHLKYYEKCQLPVLIVYWIKPQNKFYYIFAQKYIREDLSANNPSWRDQKTVVITFDSNLETAEDIDLIAVDSCLYLSLQQLNIGDKTSAIYWLDGIPQSDEKELKERTLKALTYSLNEKHSAAIEEFEKILREYVLSPIEKMYILLSLGNAYYSLSQYTEALDNYETILELVKKTDEKSSLEGKSAALGNIGVIYRDKGYLDEALNNFKAALDIDREIGHKQGEAIDLGNVGVIYRDKGDLDEAFKDLIEALDILDSHGLTYGRDTICRAIVSIIKYRKEPI
ncbi:MAG: DUF4365 domain-containing protein [Theionarchaea archaeon]|nr:DUF4365 domain-containing protein [Theionarchaea archaeon]